jgi:8-oxo-dGTP pyrophosphatase MutT (NUDIX family)
MMLEGPQPPGSAVAMARPAATVVLLRDSAGVTEVLLVRRNTQLAFHGGAWVFPGGRVDAEDYSGALDMVAAARRAATREAWEEAGVVVQPQGLTLFARWITPASLPKRFDTWFFVGRAVDEMVQVDGSEIHDHQWVAPSVALEAQRAGRLDLPPPTWVTLDRLSRLGSVASVLEVMGRGPVEEYAPRLYVCGNGACSLYAGDVAYDSGDLEAAGPRHRLWMVDSGWRYERTP